MEIHSFPCERDEWTHIAIYEWATIFTNMQNFTSSWLFGNDGGGVRGMGGGKNQKLSSFVRNIMFQKDFRHSEYFTCDVCAFTLFFVLTEPRWCCQIRWWLFMFMWILCCCSSLLIFLLFYFPYFCGSSRKIVTKLKLVLHERLHFERPKN